jgi:hypothetical protein
MTGGHSRVEETSSCGNSGFRSLDGFYRQTVSNLAASIARLSRLIISMAAELPLLKAIRHF